nr:MAG TPA: hypothetical protein [Caudoviricetes sp.]
MLNSIEPNFLITLHHAKVSNTCTHSIILIQFLLHH